MATMNLDSDLDGTQTHSPTPGNRNGSGVTTEITRKILVIGDCGVGKTSFVWRSSGGRFLGNNYKPTIGTNCVVRSVRRDESELRLAFWDIAGQDRARSLMNTYARGASGIIIMCDVASKSTLDGAKVWKQLVDEILITRPPSILVANKYDLPERVHAFNTDELNMFIHRHKIDAYFETSVKDNVNIEETISGLADLVFSFSNQTLSGSPDTHGSTLSLNYPDKSRRYCCKR